jgi:inner membrane protein
MLFFAHTGITLGASYVMAGAVQSIKRPGKGSFAWFTSLSEYVDIRILLVGSMLPDIIDKPLGMFFFRETFSSGRIFAHTLLFLVVLTAAGYYLYRRRRQTWLLVLAFGTFIHLALDQIWLMPKTVLWPFLGLSFDRIEITDWYSLWFQDLFSHPEVYIPELLGLVILLWFGVTLVAREKVGAFLKRGRSY